MVTSTYLTDTVPSHASIGVTFLKYKTNPLFPIRKVDCNIYTAVANEREKDRTRGNTSPNKSRVTDKKKIHEFYKVLTFKWHVSKSEPNRINLQINYLSEASVANFQNNGKIWIYCVDKALLPDGGKNTIQAKQWLDKCYSDSALLETTIKRWYADSNCSRTDKWCWMLRSPKFGSCLGKHQKNFTNSFLPIINWSIAR